MSTTVIVYKKKTWQSVDSPSRKMLIFWAIPEKQAIHESLALKKKRQFVIDHQFYSPLSRQDGFATNCSLVVVSELCECILASFPLSASARLKVRTLMTDSEACVGWHHPSQQYEQGKSGCCHRRALPLAQFGLFNGIYRLLLSRCWAGGGPSSEARAFVFLILSERMSSMKTGDLTGIPKGSGQSDLLVFSNLNKIDFYFLKLTNVHVLQLNVF